MKKLISFALVVIMIASLFTLCVSFVFAEGEYDAEVLDAEGTKIADLNLSELMDFGAAGTKMAGWDGYTIKLLKDVTTANSVFLVGNITFDGNGHQITFTGDSGNKNVFSVATDGSKVSEGAGPSEYKTVKIVNLKATTTGMILIPYFSNVEFGEGNDFTAPGAMFWGSRSNGGKLTFTGGKYTTSGNRAIFGLDNKSYEVDIRGGEFATSTDGAIVNQTIESTVNISGGSFSSTKAPIIQMNKAGTVNISGGKFRLSGDNIIINMLADAPGNLNVNIYDGYFYSTSWNRIAAVLAGTMNVYGGIFRNTNRTEGDLFTVRGAAKLNVYGGTIINVAGKDPVQNDNDGLYYMNIIPVGGGIVLEKVGIVRIDLDPNEIIFHADFSPDEADIEEIYDAAIETFRQNTLDIFMDCPSRERAGWLCDSFFTGRVEKLLTGKNTVEKNFLSNFIMADDFSPLPQGMIPMCYPADHPNGNYIPNWAMWFIAELNDYFERTGDSELVLQAKDRAYGILNALKKFENAEGLLERLEGWVFIEWSKSNALVQDINYPSNMMYYLVKKLMSRLYGDTELEKEAERLRNTIRKYVSCRGLPGGCNHTSRRCCRAENADKGSCHTQRSAHLELSGSR